MNAPETRSITVLGTVIALAPGEDYIGAIVDKDGKGHHVVLLPGDVSKNHASALQWAKKQGGDLPDRVEQALLFRDHAKKFKKDWYWSNAQHAGAAGYAWIQDFGSGSQGWGGVSYRVRARAVRRVPIQ